MVSQIPLNKGLIALVDEDDYQRLAAKKWHAQNCEGIWYARRTTGRSTELMHRMVVDYPIVDHINGDGLDNRKENLRTATHTQNQQNRSKRRGMSTYKGLCWDFTRGEWRARITVDGRRIHLGRFANEIEGALVYDAAARLYFGRFCAVNFPIAGERGARQTQGI